MAAYRLALGLLLIATSAGAAVASPDSEKQEITRAEDAWRKARIAGDTAFLERFYAKEMRIQNMNGELQSREADIGIFRTGQIKPRFIDHGPLDITLYGDTALVTGVDHLGGTAFGTYGEMYLRFADLLVKRDGRWQLVIQQATKTTGF